MVFMKNKNIALRACLIKQISLLVIISLVLLWTGSIYAQDCSNKITGNWQGKLNIMGKELRLVFKVAKTAGDSLTASLDSPDQGVKDIPVSKVFCSNDSVYFGIQIIAGYFSGKPDFAANIIEGKWLQAGLDLPLKLEKVDKIEEVKRPQEPKVPFPYNSEEVTFENRDAGIMLAGTFTYPKEGKNFPVVILVTGSGPQNRDEELLGHKPVLVWSDFLTRNGFAVLRYDDRGFGKSTGDFSKALTTDFASDAIAAVEYLKKRGEVNKSEIGIIGHSEGGIVAPIAANKSKDVAFVVLVGGPAVTGAEIIRLQTKLIMKQNGASEEKIQQQDDFYKAAFDVILNTADLNDTRKRVEKLTEEYLNKLSPEQKPEDSKTAIDQLSNELLSPWFRFFLKYDPRPELTKISIPVLALYGENDLQVPPSQNKDEMIKALDKSSSKKHDVIVMPGVNHLFQKTEGHSPMDYAGIEETTSPEMLELMTKWLKEVVGKLK
jgi:pimeloyl-ACP methyl ester carboxylesterase